MTLGSPFEFPSDQAVHLRRLAEIAALIATQAHHIIGRDQPVEEETLQRFLHQFTNLQRRWRGCLEVEESRAAESVAGVTKSDELPGLMSEVLVMEMLLRVWTAVLTAADAHLSPGHAGPLARHVLVSTFQLRYRVLKTVVDGRNLPLGSLVKVDRLRRRCERWCDLLLGRLAARHDVLEFAFDVRRAAEYSRAGNANTLPGMVEWPLLAAGIAKAFPEDPVAADRTETIRELAAAILAAFPAAAFDLDGQFYPPEVHRFQELPNDARGVHVLHAATPSRTANRPNDDKLRQAMIRFRKLFPRQDS